MLSGLSTNYPMIGLSLTNKFAISDLSIAGTTINVRSQCSFALTACDQAQGTGVTCYVLNNGGSHVITVDTWPGGLVWGFPGASGDPVQGNNAKPQANLAEFTIGSNGQDSYDLSNVVIRVILNFKSLAGSHLKNFPQD